MTRQQQNIPLLASGTLQRKCVCGQHKPEGGECTECSNKKKLKRPLQTKLRIGETKDRSEQEADRVAAHVMATSAHSVVRDAPPRIRSFTGQSDNRMNTVPASVDRVLASPGRPLGSALQQDMGQRFGYDFSRVRVHSGTDAEQSAQDLSANAYTTGQNIVFGAGRFAPGTHEGRHLIAHELTHVVQQAGGDPLGFSATTGAGIQRQLDSKTSKPKELAKSAQPGSDISPTPLTEARPSGHGRVQRIVISCRDMRLRLETAGILYIYKLTECSLPLGSYETKVTVTGSDFHLDFGKVAQADEEFHFRYKVEVNQENPATLLSQQATVHVDVVSEVLGANKGTEEEEKDEKRHKKPECVIRLDDRELVKSDSLNRNLFKPRKFKKEIWNHKVPLAQFGWVTVAATASGGLSGTLAASYGPGRLTNICLTHLIDRDTDGTTFGVGGRAHFSMPARAVARIMGHGKLKIAGEYLSTIEVAAAEGKLSALGEAKLAGQLDADVEILAKARKAIGAPPDPASPGSVPIDKRSITGMDLAASIGLRGRAGLMFMVDLSAGFSIAGVNLWRQTWPLARYNAGVSWKGGLAYSTNPGIRWDLGEFGVGADVDIDPAKDDILDETGFRSDSADLEEEDVVQAILDETRTRTVAPDGTSPENALPFDWHKPIEIYPTTMDFPNADDPQQIGRDDGPTDIRIPLSTVPSRDRRRYTADLDGFVHDQIGVNDWPAVTHEFQYTPYDSRSDPEKERFKRLVDALGYNRSGFDIDHVWELNLRGSEYDRFDNLWPASNQDQQLAGTRHRNQIRNYENTLGGNVNGRWFVITRVRHPA